MRLFILFFSLSSFLYASSIYPPCDNAACFNGCGIDVGAEFLYLLPSFEKNEAAIISTTVADPLLIATTSAYEVFHYNWQPAFRVSLWLEDLLCNFSIKASYLYLSETSHRNFTREANLFLITPLATNLNFFDLNTSHNFTYQDFDIGFVRGYLWGKCHLITPFLGVEGMILDQRYHASGNFDLVGPTPADIRQQGNLWGAGLKLGSGYSFWLLKCLRFHSQGAISLLYGNIKERILENIVPVSVFPPGVVASKQSDSICLPALRIALGLDYQITLCDFPLAFSLGYEFIQWFNVWSYREGIVGTTFNRSNHSNFGFNGLNLGLTICF